MSLLNAQNITHSYSTRVLAGLGSKKLTVLHDVSLSIEPGETVALLGRSGCGKSTLARLLIGLEKPESGHVFFQGKNISTHTEEERRQLYRTIQMVFQDPVSAVDPRSTVGQIIAAPLKPLCGLKGDAIRSRVIELLESVQLSAADYDKYPQQMSGGQLQRVCIARALAPKPQLIILDESISSLDLHLQTQMLDLFVQLQKNYGVAYLFVTHDLRLVERFCTRLIVLEAGRLVEQSPVTRPLLLTSKEGRALLHAVLPAFPPASRF